MADPVWKSSVFKLFLRWLEQNSPGPAKRVCFSGEYDTNQSTFEEMSNNLEVGVISNNDDEGKLLLAVLRVIIDDNAFLVEWSDIGEDKAAKVKEVVEDDELYSYLLDVYGDREDAYFSAFNISAKKFTAELDDETITKNFSQVDLWTRKRLFNELTRLLKKHNKKAKK